MQQTTHLEFVFGSVKNLPAWNDIPEDFRRERGAARPWVALFNRIFFQGGEGITFTPKPDVDVDATLRSIMAIARSFEPKHEHKQAGCALLFSQHFDDWQLAGISQTAPQ